MNKIFKVIWNEARNAYVVVSEIAKNHGSKSCSTKKLLAMLIATGVMTCASFDVLAEKPVAATTAAQQYVALKAADFPATGPSVIDKDTWGGLGKYRDAKAEWDAQQDGTKQIGKYTYTYTNKYWVRDGYVLTVDQKGGKYTPLSANQIRADVAYKDGVAEGILQSVTSTVAHNGVVTHSGDSLQKITAGSYAGVSHGGGTEVAGSWDYIINDASWEGSVGVGNYKDGYVDLIGNKMPKGFITAGSGLEWDEAKQTYTYQGKAVDYRNMYVIEGELGVFTNFDGSEVYTGTVYGKNNEILMTVKDNGKFYSYWAASVTDPSATMETYPVSKYNSDLAVIDKNITDLNKDIIKEVTLTKGDDSAIIRLVRNGGNAVDGAITVTSGGGTDGKDTFVKISNGTTEQTFATGSKVEVNGPKNAITSIKVNGVDYAINNKVYTAGANVNIDENNVISATDTTYTAGNGIAIDKTNKNAIAVKLKEDEKNLEVTADGLALKKALTVNSVKEGEFYMSNAGIGYGGKAYITSSGLNANSQKITGVAAGTISEGSTDAVNGSQLNATNKKVDELNAKAGKHTTLVAGDNVTLVEKETDKGLEYTVTAKDTTYSAGDNVAIDKDNKISVDLSKYAKTEDVAVVYDQNKTSLRSTNATVKENAIALGKGASAVKNSIAIGNGAYTQDGTLTRGQSVALGNGAVTGAKSTSIGSNAVGGREGTITIGANANNGSLYATVIGTDSKVNSMTRNSGAAATIVGAKSEIKNDNKSYSGVANGIFGSANTIENSNGVTIQGSGNTVTNAYKNMSGLDFNLGGVSVKKDAGAVGVIGGMNTVSNQIYTNVIGFGNTVAGDADNISHDVFVAGSRNNLSKVSDSIVMGNDNTISDRSNVISFGHQNTISASNAVAIGNGASVSVEGGVALGVGSVADRANAVSVGSTGANRQIINVAAGTEDTDAVNVAQLKKVSEAAANANKGWKLKTKNGTASDVKPGDEVEFDGDANIQVGNDGNKVSVTLKDALTGITSITGAGEGAGSISFADGGKVKVNDVIIEKGGKITGVAAGTADTDAVNYGQLKDVKAEAGKHTTLSNGKNTKVESTVKDGQTDYKVNVAGDLTDITSVANGDSKINLNKDSIIISNGNKYFAITNSGIGMSYIGADYSAKSIMLGENGTTISGGLNVAGSKITGVAAGEVSSTSTDAVNGSQLHAVATEAGKHSKVVSGNNINVEETDVDGQKFYKVNMNKDIILGDLSGKYVNISGTNGTIETTGYIATQDRVYADKGGKLADIDVTGNKISNGASSIVLDGSNVKVNDKVTIDQNGKISGVAAGEVSKTSTDAINGSQLNQTNENVAALDKRVTQNEADIAQNKADIATNKQNIDKLNTRVDGVEKLAKQHTTVTAGDNIAVTETTNKDGGKEYNVALKNNIDLGDKGSVTTGQTEMNNDGLKVGDKVSVTATAVTAGKTSISDEGVKVGDKTYINDKGLNANGQNITNVADGKVEKDSKDAINGGQLHQAKADINNRIDGVENQVVNNTNRINKLGSRVNKVGAGAAALAALHPMDFDPDDKLTFSAGYGNYGGENAAAIGAYYRPDEKVMFSVAGTVGNGENMVNAGVSFALDRTNHVSNSRTALAREVIDLRGQLAVMGAKMAKMEKAFGMLDETKTKLFPDVPANHWAYEYIAKLAGNGYIEGYPDGNFGGDRLMTRYEFAAMLYRAIENGAALEEKIIKEFEPELGRIRVDRISGEDGDRDKIERVRVNDTKGERDHYGNKLAK